MIEQINDSIYYEVLQKSSLIFKIKVAAHEIYDLWITNTKLQYPDYPFKANKKTLETDLKITLAESLRCLFKEEKKDKRKIPGWSEGFIFGYVSSNLSTQWSYQYVYIETDEYKQLLLLKTLIQYLNIDLTTIERLERLYNYFIEKKADIVDHINNKKEVVVSFDKFIKEKKNTVPHNEFKNKLIQYLENILLEKHHVIFNKIVDNQYQPKISDYISYDEVNLLINQIGKLKK